MPWETKEGGSEEGAGRVECHLHNDDNLKLTRGPSFNPSIQARSKVSKCSVISNN